MTTRLRTRVIWNSEDGICYETRKPLSRERAHAMARMFAQNRRVRMSAAVHERRRDRDEWRVRIYPAGLTALYNRVLKASTSRADEQGQSYRFQRRRDGLYDCFNPATGCTYALSHSECTCPQFQLRTNRVGSPCKHMVEADRRGLFYELELVP
jgi:hypothetical protein